MTQPSATAGSLANAATASPRIPGDSKRWVLEAQILWLAWPIALRLLSDQILGAIDAVVAGRVALGSLAAIAFGTAVLLVVIWPLGGLLQGLSVLGARAAGAKDAPRLVRTVRAGSVVPLAAAGFCSIVLFGCATSVSHFAPAESVGPDVANFLRIRALGVVPILVSSLLSTAWSVRGDSRLTFFSFAGNAGVHVALLTYLLLHRNGTTIVTCIAFAGLAGDVAGAVVALWRTAVSWGDLLRSRAIDISLLRKATAIAWPEGLNLLALLIPEPLTVGIIGHLGLVAVAANQILCVGNDSANAVPWSLADASQIAFGHRIGAGAGSSLPHAGHRAALLSFLVCSVVAIGVVIFASPIAGFFSENHAVVSLGAIVLATHVGVTLPLKGIGAVQEARLYAWGDTRFLMFSGTTAAAIALGMIAIGSGIPSIGVLSVPIAWGATWAARIVVSRMRITYLEQRLSKGVIA